MARCPSRKIYAHVGGKVVPVAFKDADVYAQLGDERIRISHRAHAVELQEQYGWDGTAVIVPKDGGAEIGAHIDGRAAWGHLPRDQATWRINQIAGGASEAAVGGARQLAETLFGGGNKTLGRAAYQAVEAGGARTISLLSGAVLGAGGLEAIGITSEQLARAIKELEDHPSWTMFKASEAPDWGALGELLSQVPAEHRLTVLTELARSLPLGLTAAAAAVWAQDGEKVRWICQEAPWHIVRSTVAATLRRGEPLEDVSDILRSRGIIGACLQHGDRDAYMVAALIPELADKVGEAAWTRSAEVIALLEAAEGGARSDIELPAAAEQERLAEHLLWATRLLEDRDSSELLLRAVALQQKDELLGEMMGERRLRLFVNMEKELTSILATIAANDPERAAELVLTLRDSRDTQMVKAAWRTVAHLHQQPEKMRELMLELIDAGDSQVVTLSALLDEIGDHSRAADYTPDFDGTLPGHRQLCGVDGYEPSLLLNLAEPDYHALLNAVLDRATEQQRSTLGVAAASSTLSVLLESLHVFAAAEPQRYTALTEKIAAAGMADRLSGMIGPLSSTGPDLAVGVVRGLVTGDWGSLGTTAQQAGGSSRLAGRELNDQLVELFENIPDLFEQLADAESAWLGAFGRGWARELPARYAAANPQKASALLDERSGLPFPTDSAAEGVISTVSYSRSYSGSPCHGFGAEAVCTHTGAGQRYLCERDRKHRQVGERLADLLPDLVDQAATQTLTEFEAERPEEGGLQHMTMRVRVARAATVLARRRPAQAARAFEPNLSFSGNEDSARAVNVKALAAMSPHLRPGVAEHLSRIAFKGGSDPEETFLLSAAGISVPDPLPETMVGSLRAARSDPDAKADLVRATGGKQLLELASRFPLNTAVLERLDGRTITLGEEKLTVRVIRSLAELERNARDMQNCTAGYANALRRGDVMLALIGPSGRPHYNAHRVIDRGRWRLGEVSRIGNATRHDDQELATLRALLNGEVAALPAPGGR